MQKCLSCEMRPRKRKSVYCFECFEWRTKYRRARRAKAATAGKCTNCLIRPRHDGRLRCLPCLTKRKLFYRKNRRRLIAEVAAYSKANRRKIRNYLRNYARDRRRKALAVLGSKCVRCGFSDERALQIDHKHGGGVQHHRGLNNSYRFYGVVLKWGKRRFQLLCANCNWIKRHENREI